MRRHSMTINFRKLWPVLPCLFVAVTLAAGPVTAGSITSPGLAPFTKLGVYQGVLVIAPTAAAVLEIGNGGNDIATNGDLYLRPGGLPQGSSAYVSINGTPAKADFRIPYVPATGQLGQLCLSQGTGVEDCRNSWPPPAGGSGDVYWEPYPSLSPNALKPNGTTADGTIIRIGTYSLPIPQANGRAFELYANSSLRAISVTNVMTGVNEDIGGGVYADRYGNSRIQGNFNATSGEFHIHGAAGTPWTSADHYRGADANGLNGTGSRIDADTFDSALLDGSSPFLFTSKFCIGGTNQGAPCPVGNECIGGGRCQMNNLSIQEQAVPNSLAKTTRICLRTNDSKLCTSGPTPGKPCPIGNECGVGTCTNLCSTEVLTCANDPVPGGAKCRGGPNHGNPCSYSETDPLANDNVCPDCAVGGCSPGNPDGGICTAYRCGNGAPCLLAGDCGAGGSCTRGSVEGQGGFTNSSCTSPDPTLVCPEICKRRNVLRCDGTAGAGACSTYGSFPHYLNGHPWKTTGAGGSCPSAGPTWTLLCDCFVDSLAGSPLQYQHALPPGNGGLLCTGVFQ